MTTLTKESVKFKRATLSALKAIQAMEYDIEFFNEIDGIIRASVARNPFNLGSAIEVNIIPKASEHVQIKVSSTPSSFSLLNLGINERIESRLKEQIQQLLGK